MDSARLTNILRNSRMKQLILIKLRQVIKETVPHATEKISYQIPTFAWHGNLVHFAAFEKHIGFYPTPSAIERFKEELSSFKVAKWSIQFFLDKGRIEKKERGSKRWIEVKKWRPEGAAPAFTYGNIRDASSR